MRIFSLSDILFRFFYNCFHFGRIRHKKTAEKDSDTTRSTWNVIFGPPDIIIAYSDRLIGNASRDFIAKHNIKLQTVIHGPFNVWAQLNADFVILGYGIMEQLMGKAIPNNVSAIDWQ